MAIKDYFSPKKIQEQAPISLYFDSPTAPITEQLKGTIAVESAIGRVDKNIGEPHTVDYKQIEDLFKKFGV